MLLFILRIFTLRTLRLLDLCIWCRGNIQKQTQWYLYKKKHSVYSHKYTIYMFGTR